MNKNYIVLAIVVCVFGLVIWNMNNKLNELSKKKHKKKKVKKEKTIEDENTIDQAPLYTDIHEHLKTHPDNVLEDPEGYIGDTSDMYAGTMIDGEFSEQRILENDDGLNNRAFKDNQKLTITSEACVDKMLDRTGLMNIDRCTINRPL